MDDSSLPNASHPTMNWRPSTNTLLLGLLIVCFLAAGFVIYDQVEGPAYQERLLAVAIIKQEDQQLPSYNGTQPDQLIIRNEPFAAPLLISSYYLPGTCEDLHNYYASAAPKWQWHPQGGMRTYHDPRFPNDPSRTTLHSEFTKSIQSIHLLLVIECYASDSGYSLSIKQT